MLETMVPASFQSSFVDAIDAQGNNRIISMQAVCVVKRIMKAPIV